MTPSPDSREARARALKLAARIADEYRPSMDQDVLRSWADDAVETIRRLIATAEQQRIAPVNEALARKVLLDFRRRDGLTCYAHADNERREIGYMLETLLAALSPDTAQTKGDALQSDEVKP